MFETFTRPARVVVEQATALAQEAGAGETRPEHLLGALLADEASLAVQVLEATGATVPALREELARRRAQYVDGLDADDAEALALIGIDLDEVVRRIDAHLDRPGSPRRARRARFARDSKKVLELALREAVALHHGSIGSEHLLLGLLRVGDRVVDDTFAAQGVRPDAVRAAVADAVRRAG